MTLPSEPVLDAPGAGLPAPERLAGALFFQLRSLTGSRRSFRAAFQRERAQIQQMIARWDAPACATRVLVPRLRGMEDSSRYWSVWMTLDHLRMVNHAIAGVISTLSRGEVPPGKVSTADVKPQPTADASVLEAYESSCDALLAAVDASPDLHTRVRHAHPWFGPMNAFRWFGLAAGHMGIHRAQLREILRRLPGSVT